MSVDQKLDKIVDILGRQAVTIERLTVTVEEHVKRSNIQEEELKNTNKKIEPLQRHMYMSKGAFKVLISLGILAGIAEGIAAWVKH